MNTARICRLVAALSLVSCAAVAQESPTWDGLVEVKPKRVDAGFLLPGADFRPYVKVMMDPVEVAFKKNWLKEYNRDATSMSQRLSESEAQEILQEARDNFTEVFTETFRRAGVEVVTEPGPDVLRLRPGVVDIDIVAPDTMSAGRSRTYSVEAGEAKLFLEMRDSTSGALLGRVFDRRETSQSGRAQISSRVTNLADFRALFQRWAQALVDGFEDLRALSPLPEVLTPGQKLKR